MSTAITRREIIEDEALKWGSEYVKQLQPAIDKNKEFVELILALSEANKKLRASSNDKEYQANLKKTNDLGQKSLQIWKEQDQLETQLISTKKKTELATEGTNKALIKERLELGETNKAIKLLALSNSKLASEYDKLKAKATLAAKSLQDILIAGKRADESTSQYNIRLQTAQREFDKLQTKVVAANRVVGKFNDNVGNYPKQAVQGLRDLVAAFGVVGGITAFVSVTRQAFNIIKDFENEVVNLAAIAGKSRSEIQPLELQIRKVAAASINSATDVAKLATELVKLGSSPEEAAKLLEPVNNLSIALRASAEDAATLVKSTLNAYGKGAEDAAHITDILAESANRSALDFDGLRDSFSYVAPVAKTLGISIERTAALVGTLADNGIKAESAGRLLGTGLGKIASQGLTLEQALNKINKAQESGASSLEVLNTANNLFGVEAGKLALILANNKTKIDDSTKAYENSGGALEKLTEKQLKSLSSELEILSSSFEEYILNANEANGGTKVLTTAVRFLSDNLSEIVSIITAAALAYLAFRAATAAANIQARLSVILAEQSARKQLASAIATGTATEAQLAQAAATNVGATAFQRFNAVLKENALGLALAGLILLISTIKAYSKSLEEATGETLKSTEAFLKNKETAAKNDVSINRLSDRYDELKSKTKLTADEQKELAKIIGALSKAVPGAVTEVDKYGDAIAINTVKTKEFVKANNELYNLQNRKKLAENIDLLKKLRSEQQSLTIQETDLNSKYVKGIGYVRNRNGQLEVYNKILGTGRALDLDEQILFKEKVRTNEKNLSITEANIKKLKGLTSAQKEANVAAQAKADADKKNGARTIEIIDAEIKALEDSVSTLSDKSGKEGRVIKVKIEALKAEREQIYSTQKAESDRADNGIKKAKSVADALYQLSQFRLQNAIDTNQRIIDSDKSTTDEQLDAIYEIAQLRESKNDETLRQELLKGAMEKDGIEKLTKEKLKLYLKDSENRIEGLISGTVGVEKMTAAEKLIFEKYYAEIEKLRQDDQEKKQALIDSEVGKVQAIADDQIQKENIKQNQALEAENIKFLAQMQQGSLKEKEEAILNHEQRVFEIKKEFAKKQLQLQIDSLQKELDDNKNAEADHKLSAAKVQEIEDKLYQHKVDLGNLDVENTSNNLSAKEAIEKQFAEDVKQLSQELTSSLVDLSNALFDRKIANIDAELDANNKYYERQIALAGDDVRKKDLLQKQQAIKEEEIERKKRAAQHKQAVFNKAMSAINIGLKTAEAVMAIASTGGGTYYADLGASAAVLEALTISLGAAQVAAVLATPIPKYRMGRKDGPDEMAIVGDGGKSEVISDQGGSNPVITPNVPTYVQLKKRQMVHKSLDDYKTYLKNSILSNVAVEGRNAKEYQSILTVNNESGYSKELLEELRRNTKAIEKNKTNIVINTPKSPDIAHEIWKLKNTNWRA